MSAATDSASRFRRFRELCVLYLSTYIPSAKVPAPPNPRMSLRVLEAPQSDIEGIEDFSFVVSAATTARPSEGLALAQNAARFSQKKYAALILARPNKGIDEAYAILSFGTLSRMLKERELHLRQLEDAKK